jgi:hypothetical protein
MDALVIYESMFGNTKEIAEAVARGMSMRLDTTIWEVGEAPRDIDEETTLLVLGGPTDAFGMSRGNTREGAQREISRPVISRDMGLREWLDEAAIPTGLEVAAFDTSLRKWHKLGTASRSAAKRFRRKGFVIACPPETFFVESTTGPLADGELTRAYEWGAHLAIRHALDHVEQVLGAAHETQELVAEGGRRAS